jgi:hypothetical protein
MGGLSYPSSSFIPSDAADAAPITNPGREPASNMPINLHRLALSTHKATTTAISPRPTQPNQTTPSPDHWPTDAINTPTHNGSIIAYFHSAISTNQPPADDQQQQRQS